MPLVQGRNWCGTLQLEGADFDGEGYLRRLLDAGVIKYGVGQVECGSHFHFQFYLQFGTCKALSWLKNRVDGSAHWEVARGNPSQNKAYCTKSDTRVSGPWEVGVAATQGQERGLTEAVEAIKMGEPIHEVAARYSEIWVRHGRGLVDLRKTLRLEADRRVFGPDGPELWVLWGPSGTGKSRYAQEAWPDAFWKAPYEKWWDGYSGQATVVIDDFSGACMRLKDFQRLIDWYPLWVETKGGSVPMLAQRYVITSNYAPGSWYNERLDPGQTVLRRVRDFAEKFGRVIAFPREAPAALSIQDLWQLPMNEC